MLRFGMIGAGIISARHLKALDKNPHTQIAAVADLNLEKAHQAADSYGAAIYSDYHEMLEKETLDAVIINLPHFLHEECTIACAKKGIHVLVEKPMAVSADACRSMTRACKEAGVVMQIGHVQRYFPENKKAKEIVESGELGKLLMIHDVRTSFYFSENRPGWFLKKELSGGGILMNLGAHSIDKIKYLTGSSFVEVTGCCGFERPEYDVEGNGQMFLRTESGVTASVTLCGYHDLPFNETTLYFSGGVLKLSTGKNLEIWENGSFKELVCSDSQLPFDEQLEDFVKAVLDGITPATDGVYSEDVIAVIEKIYQKTGEINEKEKSPLMREIYKSRYLFLLFLPCLIYYILFKYVPMWGILISFKDFKPFIGFAGSEWVGMKHFEQFFSSPDAWRIIRNTLQLGLYSLIWGFPFPIIFALLLNEVTSLKYKKIVQTVSYMPHFLSAVVVCGMVTTFLSPIRGVVNQMIGVFGVEPINFMALSKYFRTIYVVSDIWQQIGWGAIIYIAAITNVDAQLYEAAMIDGANKWKQIWYITLPCIAPTIVTMLILRTGSILEVGLEKVLLLQNPAIYETADIIATYVYRQGIAGSNMSYATAIGLFSALTNLVLLLTANFFSKKFSETSLF